MNFKQWLAETESQEPVSPEPPMRERPPPSGWRYGNYCGPGPKFDRKTCDRLDDGRPLPKPTNAVDAACKVHDADYCGCNVDWRAGFLFGKGTPCSKEADVKLVKTLGQLAKDRAFKTNGEWIAANVIRNYFRLHSWMQNGSVTTI